MNSKKLGDIDEILMRILFGCKDRSLPIESINILTAIKHLDRRFGKDNIFLYFYKTLSESAHPNYFGMLGAYGHIDKINKTMNFKKGNQKTGMLATMPLVTILEVFLHYYGKLTELMPSFTSVCDAELKTKRN